MFSDLTSLWEWDVLTVDIWFLFDCMMYRLTCRMKIVRLIGELSNSIPYKLLWLDTTGAADINFCQQVRAQLEQQWVTSQLPGDSFQLSLNWYKSGLMMIECLFFLQLIMRAMIGFKGEDCNMLGIWISFPRISLWGYIWLFLSILDREVRYSCRETERPMFVT